MYFSRFIHTGLSRLMVNKSSLHCLNFVYARHGSQKAHFKRVFPVFNLHKKNLFPFHDNLPHRDVLLKCVYYDSKACSYYVAIRSYDHNCT